MPGSATHIGGHQSLTQDGVSGPAAETQILTALAAATSVTPASV